MVSGSQLWLPKQLPRLWWCLEQREVWTGSAKWHFDSHWISKTFFFKSVKYKWQLMIRFRTSSNLTTEPQWYICLLCHNTQWYDQQGWHMLHWQKCTPNKDVTQLENSKNTQVFPFAGFVWFYKYYITRALFALNNLSSLGHSHVSLFFISEEQKKVWLTTIEMLIGVHLCQCYIMPAFLMML